MDILRSTNPTARKEYRCGLCGSIIEKGDKYNKTAFVEDGEIDRTICCTRCAYIIDALEIDEDDIYYFEDIIFEYIEEHHYDKETGCIEPYWNLPFHKLVEKVYNELKEKEKKY